MFLFLPVKVAIDITGSTIWIPKLARVGSLWVYSREDTTIRWGEREREKDRDRKRQRETEKQRDREKEKERQQV